MRINTTSRRAVELGLIAVLIVGPFISYCAGFILLVTGVVASYESDSIWSGVLSGVLAVIITRGRLIGPWRTANWMGVIAMILWAIPNIPIVWYHNSLHEWIIGVVIVAIESAAAWLTGYVAVSATRRVFCHDWQES